MGERHHITFGTMTAASRVAEDRHHFWQRHLGSDVLTRICSKKNSSSQIHLVAYYVDVKVEEFFDFSVL